MKKLKEDIKEWNKILSNYIGANIRTHGFGGGAKYSFNLLDSLYQQKIIELKNIEEFKDISIYSDFKVFNDEELESILRSMDQKYTDNKMPAYVKFIDIEDKIPKFKKENISNWNFLMFRYKVILKILKAIIILFVWNVT